MEELSFDSFTKKIHIKTSIERMYECWTTKEGMESWFLRKADYTTPEGQIRDNLETTKNGDSYTWQWHNWDGTEQGMILQANGTDFMEFSFAGDICKVSVKLEEKANTVLVTLKQYDMPTDEKTKLDIYNGCSCGWTFWLANLKAYIEHGILLNETEFDLTDIPQAGHIYVNM